MFDFHKRLRFQCSWWGDALLTKGVRMYKKPTDEDEDGLFELALAFFSQNDVLFSGAVADRVPWTGEDASDRRKRLDRLHWTRQATRLSRFGAQPK
jgi:hypothetical protein